MCAPSPLRGHLALDELRFSTAALRDYIIFASSTLPSFMCVSVLPYLFLGSISFDSRVGVGCQSVGTVLSSQT